MSEYQFYEFLSVDRPLTEREQRELRSISTRAEISPTRFSNEYNWGDLNAETSELLERYFDVHIYLANWGTRRFALRLPRGAVSIDTVKQYCSSEAASAWRAGEHVVIDLQSQWDDDGGWVESEGWMDSLQGVRDELLRGDLRILYIAWLLGVEMGEVSEDDEEPPVPPGLGNLPESLRSLSEFLRIDAFLIEAASEGSATRKDERPHLAEWIADLPVDEKDALLFRVTQGEQVQVAATLVRRFRDEMGPTAGDVDRAPRTADQLLTRADELRETFEREQERKAAAARRRREEAAAIARAKHLDALAARQPEAWTDVEKLIELRQAKPYDQAVALLVDLRDLAAREGEVREFDKQVSAIRLRHARKLALIAMLTIIRASRSTASSLQRVRSSRSFRPWHPNDR